MPAGAGTAPPAGGRGGRGGSGTELQAASIPRMATRIRNRNMLWILLEALGALLLLLLIVWWTMFAGRKKGEPERDDDGRGRS